MFKGLPKKKYYFKQSIRIKTNLPQRGAEKSGAQDQGYRTTETRKISGNREGRRRMYSGKLAIFWQMVLMIQVFATFLSGCVTTRFDVSVPQGIPAGSTGKIREETIRLDLDDLSLTVQLQNFRFRGGGPLKPLGMWMGIEARNGPFLLEPHRVFLTIDEGRMIRPITFLGPASPWESPRAAGLGCGPRIYNWGWAFSKIDVSQRDVEKGNTAKGVFAPSAGPVSFQGKACFMFWFDVDPSPEQSFVVSIRGISQAGKAIQIPEIRFQKGSVRKTFSTP